MAIMLEVVDTDGLSARGAAPGKYNPDVLDDLKRRVMDMYREALAFRVQLGLYPDVDLEVEVPELEDGVQIDEAP